MAGTVPSVQPDHDFHAEAKALHGDFKRPFTDIITPQALAQLSGDPGSDDKSGLAFALKSAVSYDSASTHVSGSLETKRNGGWCTLSTCTVMGLNILEVVTADKIVGQIFTEHPLDGYVPRISFLATRFENLRICGHKVKLDWDMTVLGDKPEGDAAYTRDRALVTHLGGRSGRICDHRTLSEVARKRYTDVPKKVDVGKPKETEILECSLVTSSRGNFPGRCYGHVIHVPDFGEIYLATVKVTQTDFDPGGIPHTTTVELNMIEAKLGCAATGTLNAGGCITNGNKKPAPPPGP